MKIQRWVVLGLIALNVAFLTALVVRTTHESTAYAQARSHGAFAILPGHVNGKMVFWVLETNTGRLAALRSEPGTKQVIPIATADVGKDLDHAFKR